ncbi:MAG: neutral/alkaline non-lysosomal ceramidase N-terminal domain-containing protein [Thermoguttaceae bacterium]
MKKSFPFFGSFLLAIFLLTTLFATNLYAENGWKAGVARTVITPKEPVWQIGFMDRTEPAKETLADLWAKALAVEDADGNKGLIITMDILAIKRDVSDEIKKRIAEKHGLDKSRIVLSSSHTHSGPGISLTPFEIMPENDKRLGPIIKYSNQFVDQLVELADQAIAGMKPARIFSGNGISRMQVNRRDDAGNGPLDNPVGTHDYSVPVLKVQAKDEKGEIMAVLFGYACHPTTLNMNKFSGDWCGFAQEEVEKRLPGTTAMFFQGACGDMTIFPRGAENYSRHIGEGIAVVVDCMVREPLTEQEPNLAIAYTEVELPYGWQPEKKEMEAIARFAPNEYLQGYARHLVKMFNEKGELDKTYPQYPIQIWKIGNQPFVIFGGETLVQYAVHAKKLFGDQTFVMGYANDVMGYIPSAKAIREGGYEVVESQIGYARPGRWAPEIEKIIVDATAQLGEQVGLTPDKSKVQLTE